MWNPIESKPELVECGTTYYVEFWVMVKSE